MQKTILAAAIVFMLLLPAVSLADTEDGMNPYLSVGRAPAIEINLTHSDFNLSFAGAILHMDRHNYSAKFASQKWVFATRNSTTVEYSALVKFVPMHEFEGGFPPIGEGNSTEDNAMAGMPNVSIPGAIMPVQAEFDILFTRAGMTLLSANGSRINTTGIAITIDVSSSQISGDGYLEVIQFLGANIDHSFWPFHDFHGYASGEREKEDHGVSVREGNFSAYYIWNNTYSLNSKLLSMANSTYTGDGITVVMFRYNFTGGLQELSQDPYFTVPDFNVFQGKFIDQGIQTARDFLIAHAELFSAGIASGMVFLGIPYGIYRRRRL